MRRWMTIHRYLSCFLAPAMLFFAISGAWQAFRLHDSRKDGSYTAPPPLAALSRVHKAEHMSGAAGVAFRALEALVAISFVTSALIGLEMAFRMTRPRWLVWACLGGGVLVPSLLAMAAQ